MISIGLIGGLFLACLIVIIMDATDTPQKRVMRQQQETIEAETNTVAIKPKRINSEDLNTIIVCVMVLIAILIASLAYGLHCVEISDIQTVRVRQKTGSSVLVSRSNYITVRTIMLALFSANLYAWIGRIIRNKVPYKLILSPTQLILCETNSRYKGKGMYKNTYIDISTINYVSTEGFDYYEISCTDTFNRDYTYVLKHKELNLSEKEFEKLFERYGVKVLTSPF